MMKIIGLIIMSIALFFIAFGVLGLFRFKNVYPRLLVASLVDSAGFLTLMIGVLIYSGFNFFSLKVLLIMLLMLVVNPLVSHIIARSAYYSGYKVGKD